MDILNELMKELEDFKNGKKPWDMVNEMAGKKIVSYEAWLHEKISKDIERRTENLIQIRNSIRNESKVIIEQLAVYTEKIISNHEERYEHKQRSDWKDSDEECDE
jgi:hypothetical protein